jgi:hypothetical protein
MSNESGTERLAAATEAQSGQAEALLAALRLPRQGRIY